MGGGPSSQLCAHCGSELRAGTRYCHLCGQSVSGPDADPQTAPLNLPGGGLHPRDTAQDTVTAAAFPAYPADPTGPSPADHQPTDWQPPAFQPPAYQPAAYQPADYQPGGHQTPDYPPTAYPPGGHEAADYQATAYPGPEYQPAAYQAPDYGNGGYPPPDSGRGHRGPGRRGRPRGDYQAASHQPGGYSADGYPPPAQPPGGGSRRGRIIVGVLAVVVAVGGVAAGLLVSRAHSSPGHLAGSGQSTAARTAGPTTVGSSGTAAPTSPPSSPAVSAQRQGAGNLSALLSQSVSDRGAINNAYNDVQTCGPTLAQDQATFQQAVASRQGLLSRLGTMPDASALPAGMISSLTQAWQASISADQDFAAWAQDESANCTPGGSDANLSAAAGPDDQATQDKTAFAGRWNPIAQQYGLPTYSQDQL
jgi:hypothetical protein